MTRNILIVGKNGIASVKFGISVFTKWISMTYYELQMRRARKQPFRSGKVHFNLFYITGFTGFI